MNKKAVLVLTLGVIGVSAGSLFVRLADSPALATAAYRMTFSFLILAPFALVKARKEIFSLSKREKGSLRSGRFFPRLAFRDLDQFARSHLGREQRSLGQHHPHLGWDHRSPGHWRNNESVFLVGLRPLPGGGFRSLRKGFQPELRNRSRRQPGLGRRLFRRPLPDDRAKPQKEAFAPFLRHDLLRFGFRFSLDRRLGFRSASQRIFERHLGCPALLGRGLSNSRAYPLQLVPPVDQRRDRLARLARRTHRSHPARLGLPSPRAVDPAADGRGRLDSLWRFPRRPEQGAKSTQEV